jgi:hypothetical protein
MRPRCSGTLIAMLETKPISILPCATAGATARSGGGVWPIRYSRIGHSAFLGAGISMRIPRTLPA